MFLDIQYFYILCKFLYYLCNLILFVSFVNGKIQELEFRRPQVIFEVFFLLITLDVLYKYF